MSKPWHKFHSNADNTQNGNQALSQDVPTLLYISNSSGDDSKGILYRMRQKLLDDL
jgi:hypothetical protein